MTKWRNKYQSSFKVKVSYRKGKTRGTIALPAPIVKHVFHNCDYIEFVLDINRPGEAIVRPADSEKKDSCTRKGYD